MKNCLTKKIISALAIFVAIAFLYVAKHNFVANLLLILLVIFATPLRAYLVSKLIMQLIHVLKLAPKISNTEKIALTSGTVWVDGELFSGKPNFTKIWQESYPTLTCEEQSFLDNQVNKVCEMCNDYQVQQLKDLPQEVWQFLKQEKFFGMIIPKSYGGLGFSAFAHSCVIEKLASRSVCLAITVMVPNSLGPAELLLHYGTKQQQDNYLPKLACGQDLPCFALTEPNAGSDATSIVSNGVLFTDSNGEIKIRLNWNKRYITLGAYATLIGVAFQLKDPENLLFQNSDVGITCALIPHNTQGVRQGRRHNPLFTPFVNSPLNGENVIVGLNAVIGEKSRLGKGWQMLMECLSAGRGISLPSTSCGGSKFVLAVACAYSNLREQFSTEIGKFEAIEEVLANIAGKTFALDAMRSFTASSVDSGVKPAVVSAIAKYHATEMFRQNINAGMDILGGAGIICGKRNLFSAPYFSTPISITVEGANILTRGLIQFGQGAIMSHPYIYKEFMAIENNNVAEFDKAFWQHICHFIRNIGLSIILSLTRGYAFSFMQSGKIAKYQRKIAWCSATFAFLADIALLKFGGKLKSKEKLNGRFGDVLSAMYISVCILRKIQHSAISPQQYLTAEYALKEQLCKAQQAIEGIYQNLFTGLLAWLFKPINWWIKLNTFSCPASDTETHQIAQALLNDAEFQNSLTNGIYKTNNKDDSFGRFIYALELKTQAKDAIKQIKQAIKEKNLPKENWQNLIILALQKNIIHEEQANLLHNTKLAIAEVVAVDDYTLEEYQKI
jgi:acyl-CoA dehydrogenase